MRAFGLVIFLGLSVNLWAQNTEVSGRVFDGTNNEPLPFANVIVQGEEIGTTTDFDGKFTIVGLSPGTYNFEFSFIGYKPYVLSEIQVTNLKPVYLEVGLIEDANQLETVDVVANPFEGREEAPLSVQSIGVDEIRRSAGGNQDISQVVANFPGVASTPNFRNDLIVRGGSPGENVFYLDGIEIPSINHFSTQGSSGGPVGMINVNLISSVDFYTGAFPAERGNVLSSVMELRLMDGRTDKWGYRVQLGASDLGITAEGPISSKATFIGSVRRSYLQFLFSALQLPFLPTYNDAQFKVRYRIDPKNEIVFLGLGAIDQFELNTAANETDAQRYILNNLPVNEQWNYTIGAKYTNFQESGFSTLVLSRFHLNNTATKYKDNIESPENLILDYASQEIENKLRFEQLWRKEQWKIIVGANAELVRYLNNTKRLIPVGNEVLTNIYETDLPLFNYGLFGSVARNIGQRWTASLGLRLDASNYSAYTNKPWEQISPRLALSYSVNDVLSINANTGIYYQLPPYTVMGFQNGDSGFINKDNGIGFIRSDHFVLGTEYILPFSARIAIEGFWKNYTNYPFLLADSISLANLGGDFGVIGDEPATPESKGRAYGVEIVYQQKLRAGFYGLLSYTWVRSEFEDKNGNLVSSSWDNRHLLTFTGGKRFGKGWELGLRWRFLGGTPYTPYDVPRSSLKEIWDVTGRGLPDYDQLNTLRGDNFTQLDMRIDKKWFFQRWNLNLYFDVQNILNQQLENQPFLDVVYDENGLPVENPNDPSRYLVRGLENSSGTLLPTLGVIVDF
jgi:hypothetical protein